MLDTARDLDRHKERRSLLARLRRGVAHLLGDQQRSGMTRDEALAKARLPALQQETKAAIGEVGKYLTFHEIYEELRQPRYPQASTWDARGRYERACLQAAGIYGALCERDGQSDAQAREALRCAGEAGSAAQVEPQARRLAMLARAAGAAMAVALGSSSLKPVDDIQVQDGSKSPTSVVSRKRRHAQHVGRQE